jgi:hypothetical protein
MHEWEKQWSFEAMVSPGINQTSRVASLLFPNYREHGVPLRRGGVGNVGNTNN